MEIILRKDQWKINDILNVLSIVQLDNYEEELFLRFKIKADKSVTDICKKLKNHVDINSNILKLFLSIEWNFKNLPCEPKNLSEIKNLDELPEYFRNIDMEKIKYNTIKFLYEDESSKDEDKVKEKVESIIRNKELLIEFVSGIEMKSDAKWELCNFINDPKSYYEEFISILEKTIPIYKKLISKHESKVEKFNRYLQKKIDEKGLSYFTEIIDTPLGLEKYETIYISTSFIRSEVIIISEDCNEVYLMVGINVEECLKIFRGKDRLEFGLKVLNTLSDPIKFNILQFIKEKECFGKEISEHTGLSKAALSYHTDYLVSMGMIKYNKKGNRIYYSLNGEVIKSAISMVDDYFN